MHWIGLILLFGLLGGPLGAQSPLDGYVIGTLAGSDPIRDGRPASEALLHQPTGVAVDSAGNVYIADQSNGLVRRVGLDGFISTVAGTVERIGFGPQATDETFQPECVVVSPDDRVHFCSRRRVFELLADGTTRVVVGTGGSSGAADGSPAVEAGFLILSDIAFGPDGSLYISDRGNHTVRRVRPDGVITAFAGTGESGFSGDGGPAEQAQLNSPSAIDVAADGAVLINDAGNTRIRRVGSDGVIQTVAGNGESGSGGNDGPATEAALPFVTTVAATPNGDFLIASFGSIRRVDADGVIRFFGGAGSSALGDGEPIERASFRGIESMAFGADGSLYIADRQNQRVRRASPEGIVETFAGGSHLLGDDGPAAEAQIFEPRGMAQDGAGNLYIADSSNYVVRRVSPDGWITTVAGSGDMGPFGQEGPATEVRFRAPIDVAIHPLTGELHILDAADGRVRRVDSAGMMTTVVGTGRLGNTGDGGPADEAQIRFPQTINFSPSGDMYLSDIFSHVVRKVSGGVITTIAGTGTAGSTGDGGPSTAAQLQRPHATVATESGELFIAESNRIRRVSPEGVISLFAEVEGEPTYLSITPSGDLLASVPNLNRIYRIHRDGSVEQFGAFAFGFGGDGGPARLARVNQIAAALEAPDGRILLSDQGNHRIRTLAIGPTLASLPVRQAGSFFGGAMSPETIVSLFGSNLAPETIAAETTPLPTTLGGTRVIVRDSQGVERESALFFVSPHQINLMIPAGTALGAGTILVRTASGQEAQATLSITGATPGLFSANADGRGVAAAFALRVDAAGTQTTFPVFESQESEDALVPAPIDLGPAGEQVYLLLFGTGLRGASSVLARIDGEVVPTLFFGAQGDFVGLDQINIGPIPRDLVGKGAVDVRLEAAGRASNTVVISVR